MSAPATQKVAFAETLPAWVEYDRKVLRFSCYFQEAVVESPYENYRVRK